MFLPPKYREGPRIADPVLQFRVTIEHMAKFGDDRPERPWMLGAEKEINKHHQ